MKYMLMIYTNEATRKALETGTDGIMAEVDAIMKELTDSGEFVGGQALSDPINSRSVRPQGGVPVVTDGPFLEAKEHLAGYLIVDCENIERATEIAARWPDAKLGGMEVRPIMDEVGMEI